MNTDYQLRKDIDSVIELADYLNNLVEEAGVSSFKDLFANFTTKSDSELNKAILNTDLDKLSKDLDGLNDDLNLLNEDLYDAEGHLKVTEEDLNQAKESITALSNSLTQLDTDLNNAEADLEDIESELSTTKTNLNKALSDLTNLSNELSSAKNRITTAEGKITTAENSISNHQTSISNLNTELNSAKDRITATENSLTTANNSISAHETSISNLNTELDGAESRLTTTEQNIQSLRTSLTELDGSLGLLSDMLVNFQGTLTEFDEELVRKGIDKAELNSDIYKLVSQICVVKQDITDTDTKIDDTVTDINNLDTSVVPNLKNKIQEAKASGDTAQQDLATAKTDINNLNSTTFPNLKNKIDEAKASGDNAQTALQQAKDDLEDLNTTVFPNLVGAIDDAQASGDTAQSNLTSAITKINSATADDGTFTQLHTSIANAKSAGDTAQANLDDSIDDIENLTGTIFPNLKNTINTVQGDITDVQGDITTVQGDIANVNSIVNFVLATQNTWQPLYVGAVDRTTLNSLITHYNLKLDNIHYAYNNGNYYICDGISWVQYDGSIIQNNIEFSCIVVDGFNQNIQQIASNMDISEVYDLSNNCFYRYSGSTWSQVTAMNYYEQVSFSTLFNASRNSYGSSLSSSVLHSQTEINDEIFNKLTTHTHTLSEITDLTDTGWVAFPFNSNASTDSSSPMYCRRWGKMVTIQGIGRLTNTLSGNGSIAIGYVVLGAEPSISVASPWTGNNQQGFIKIDTEGKVTLNNRNGSSGTMAANSYFIINCTYMID